MSRFALPELSLVDDPYWPGEGGQSGNKQKRDTLFRHSPGSQLTVGGGNVTHIQCPLVSAIIKICFKRSLIFVSPILDSLSFLISLFGQNPITGATFWQKRRRIGKHVCEDGVAEGLSPKWLLPSSAVLLSPASPDRKLLPLCCSSSSNASSAFKEIYCRAMSLYFKRKGRALLRRGQFGRDQSSQGDVNVHTIYRSKE